MNALSPYAILHITGAQAMSYLQNLLTADMQILDNHHWTAAAFCSPQGKVQATMRLAKIDDEFFAFLPHPLSAAIFKRWQLFSLNQAVRLQWREDLKLQISADTSQTAKQTQGQLQLGGISGFGAADNIKARFAQITPPTQDQFLPQMLGLENSSALSYNKGCYLGQEVIARAHSRAPVRRHLHTLQSLNNQSTNLLAGDSLSVENQNAAIIIESCVIEHKCLALAVVQDRYLDSQMQDAAGNIYTIIYA